MIHNVAILSILPHMHKCEPILDLVYVSVNRRTDETRSGGEGVMCVDFRVNIPETDLLGCSISPTDPPPL